MERIGPPFGRVDVGISPGAVLRALLAIIALLFATHVAAIALRDLHGYQSAWGFVPLFDLDREGNLPTWFSTMMLTACAVLLFGIQRIERERGDRFAPYWTGLATIFAYLSVDEASGLHELTVFPLSRLIDPASGFTQPWVIPFGLFAAMVGVVYLRFLLALPRRLAVLFVLAGALFVGGAVGGELVSWNYRWPAMEAAPGDGIARTQASHSFGYALLAGGEEICEMVGAAVFLYALLTRLGDTPLAFTLRAGGARHPQPVASTASLLPAGAMGRRPEPDGLSASRPPHSGTTRAVPLH